MERSEYPQPIPDEAQPGVSYSSLKVFADCERKWALTYLADFFPNSVKWAAIKQKMVITEPVLLGSIFHDTVDEAMRSYIESGEWPNDLPAVARKISQSYYDYSRAWCTAQLEQTKWPKKPGNEKPLAEMMEGRSLDKVWAKRILEQIGTWLARYNSFIRNEGVFDMPRSCLLLPAKTPARPWYWVEDAPVYSPFDFASNFEGEVVIYDWKTGDSDKGAYGVREQLLFYSGFAHKEWSAPWSSILLCAVWLDGNEPTTFQPREVSFAQTSAGWAEAYRELIKRRAAVMADRSQLTKLFPMCEDTRNCQYCAFHCCEGKQRAPGICETREP
jgi:hypothetical protein